MAELQPPEQPPSAAAAVTTLTTGLPPLTLSSTLPPPLDIDNNNNNLNLVHTNNNDNLAHQSLAPKRQRRPSVRLGEIGGDTPANFSKSWKFPKHPTVAAKSNSKVRPLTNLVNGGVDYSEDNLDFSNRRLKSKRSGKRVRTNWNSTSARPLNNGGGAYENNNETGELIRDFEPEEGSEGPMKEQQIPSPVHSVENDFWRPARTSSLPDQSNSRDRKCGTTSNNNDHGNLGNNSAGVREWLIGLGLGRYAPVFEIHEVDDEVLPMLTLEDLKDMGINAVGSRRKMYSSILKLYAILENETPSTEEREGISFCKFVVDGIWLKWWFRLSKVHNSSP